MTDIHLFRCHHHSTATCVMSHVCLVCLSAASLSTELGIADVQRIFCAHTQILHFFIIISYFDLKPGLNPFQAKA